MKQVSSVFFLSVLLILTACETAKSPSGSETTIKTDSLPISDAIVAERPAFTPSQLSSACEFDSVTFEQEYGKGLLLLRFNAFPFKVFAKPDTSSQFLLLSRSETHYGTINVSDQPDGYFQWYQSPNEYDDGMIIRTNDEHPDQPIRIRLNDESQDWWIIPDTSIASQNRKYFLISWDQYAGGQTFFISADNAEDNPLRTTPQDTAQVIPYPGKFPLYNVTAVEFPWIQVNHLLEKNGVYGNDKWSEPIGWMKWYCDGTERIDRLDPYELEGYYAEEE